MCVCPCPCPAYGSLVSRWPSLSPRFVAMNSLPGTAPCNLHSAYSPTDEVIERSDRIPTCLLACLLVFCPRCYIYAFYSSNINITPPIINVRVSLLHRLQLHRNIFSLNRASTKLVNFSTVFFFTLIFFSLFNFLKIFHMNFGNLFWQSSCSFWLQSLGEFFSISLKM